MRVRSVQAYLQELLHSFDVLLGGLTEIDRGQMQPKRVNQNVYRFINYSSNALTKKEEKRKKKRERKKPKKKERKREKDTYADPA